MCPSGRQAGPWQRADTYVSPALPPVQDGSCNGLQHYAALGRDLIGATSVNLMPCSVPQDVYSVVAQQVRHGGTQGVFSGSASALTGSR